MCWIFAQISDEKEMVAVLMRKLCVREWIEGYLNFWQKLVGAESTSSWIYNTFTILQSFPLWKWSIKRLWDFKSCQLKISIALQALKLPRHWHVKVGFFMEECEVFEIKHGSFYVTWHDLLLVFPSFPLWVNLFLFFFVYCLVVRGFLFRFFGFTFLAWPCDVKIIRSSNGKL